MYCQKEDIESLIEQKKKKSKGLLRLFGLFGFGDDDLIEVEEDEPEIEDKDVEEEPAEEFRVPETERAEESKTDWDNCYDVRSQGDRIGLISINPADGSVFTVGETVDVRVELQYTLESHDEGRVELWFELPEHRGGGAAGFADTKITKGSGIVVIEGSFEVPDLDDAYIAFSLEPPASAYDVYTGCWVSLERGIAGTYTIE